jgi:hypothetical protein
MSSITSNLHGLLFIPAQEYKKRGAVGALKGIQKESMSLIKTITRETLNAAHQVSMLIAHSLVSLVTPPEEYVLYSTALFSVFSYISDI